MYQKRNEKILKTELKKYHKRNNVILKAELKKYWIKRKKQRNKILKIEQITNKKINTVCSNMKESYKLFNNNCEGIVKMFFTATIAHAVIDRTNNNKTMITSQTSTLWSIGSNKPQIQRTKQQH